MKQPRTKSAGLFHEMISQIICRVCLRSCLENIEVKLLDTYPFPVIRYGTLRFVSILTNLS